MRYPTPNYSVQPTGDRGKILITEDIDGVPATRSLVTVADGTAGQLVRQLGALRDSRISLLWHDARNVPGKPSMLRRQLLDSFDGGRDVDSKPLRQLVELTAGLTDAQRRAVRDEIGRLFDGTEDILVPVLLTDEFDGVRFTTFANAVLDGCTDDELVGIADGGGHLYETLLAGLRADDDDIDEACDTEWIDVRVDHKAFAAWVVRHRPHLVEELEDMPEFIGEFIY